MKMISVMRSAVFEQDRFDGATEMIAGFDGVHKEVVNLALLHDVERVWGTGVEAGEEAGALTAGFLFKATKLIECEALGGFAIAMTKLADGGLQFLDHGGQGFALSLKAGMDVGHVVEDDALGGVGDAVDDAIELVGELIDVFAIERGYECLVETAQDLAREDVAAMALFFNLGGSLMIYIDAVEELT